jgi:SAM-dependent methyltransferase
MKTLPALRSRIRTFLLMLYRRWQSMPMPIPPEPFDQEKLMAAEAALRGLPTSDAAARAYLEKHIPRLARTLALVPPPRATGRVLELGCYMQMTPLLERLCGYREVRGAYYGPQGRLDHRTLAFPDGDFSCAVDHFDAERDPFPYPDEHFDLVIAAEIIEHMVYDPMHLLIESKRVLAEGGMLLLSTPNAAGLALLAKALSGVDNPQIYPHYKMPNPDDPEIGHVHEYTAMELRRTVEAAGFEIDRLFTTFLNEYAGHRWLLSFLEVNGYGTEDRGEQTWCLARKRSGLAVNRYPDFLYYGA